MSIDPTINDFLGLYFHQDWVLDYGTWENAVDTFVAENPTDLDATVDAVDALIADAADTAAIEAVLRAVGCQYRDRTGAMTKVDWLRAVLARLRVLQAKRISPTRTPG